MAGSACSTWGSPLRPGRGSCCSTSRSPGPPPPRARASPPPRLRLLDEPLAGLAAAERARIAALLTTIAAEIPVLLVEHDIDRVFQIADHVTVMNEGKVLVDGTVEDARSDAKVREVYIGS